VTAPRAWSGISAPECLKDSDAPQQPPVDVTELEAELDDVAHLRPALQARARAELTAEHLPLTKVTVITRAVQILHRTNGDEAA
jgi:hypothetical protein